MNERTLDLDGPVRTVDFGGHGPPLVLVHGLGGSSVNWLAVGGALASHGHVVALDLPGFGRTPLAGRSAGVSESAALLGRFVDALGEGPAILVGNSMGGLVSLMEAARDPLRVRALALVSPASPPVTSRGVSVSFAAGLGVVAVPYLGEAVVRRRLRVEPERYVEDLLSLVCRHPERVPEPVRAAHVALARERQEMPWAPLAFAQATRSLLPMLGARRYHRLADSVRAPVLLLHGGDDRVVSVDASRALAGRHPSWRFEILEGVGHVPQMEAPGAFVAHLSGWLDALPALAAA